MRLQSFYSSLRVVVRKPIDRKNCILNYQRSLLSIVISGCLVLAALAGLIWVNLRFSSQNPGGSDFYIYWNASRAWAVDGISPYDKQVEQRAKSSVGTTLNNTPAADASYTFPYPLYSMVFFVPFGPLDYTLARALWMTLLEAALGISAVLSLRLAKWRISLLGIGAVLLFTLLGYSGLQGIVSGQLATLDSIFLIGAIILVQNKRDMDAGLLFALATIRPQASLMLVIFAFIWSLSARRYRVALGITGGIAFLVILSMVFLPNWLVQWFWQILDQVKNPIQNSSVISILAGVFPGISKPLTYVLIGILSFYLLLEWSIAWGKRGEWFTWTALMTLVVTQFIGIRGSTVDFITLLPVFFLLFQSWQERWGKPGQTVAWVTLGLIFAGMWLLFLLTVHNTPESPLLFISIPLGAMLALWWVRWWTLHRPKLFFDEYKI